VLLCEEIIFHNHMDYDKFHIFKIQNEELVSGISGMNRTALGIDV
jgi:hypothetical protein